MDKISPAQRSEVMRRIRSQDTKPELIVRKLLFSLGYRYRLHAKDLPGTPDIVFRRRRKVIFVHGCFWHQHKKGSCKHSHLPKSNPNFWKAKLSRNVKRDRDVLSRLKSLGWDVLIIWECELDSIDEISSRLINFLPRGSRGRDFKRP